MPSVLDTSDSSSSEQLQQPPQQHTAPPHVPTKEWFDVMGLDYETTYGHNAGLHRAVDKLTALLRPGCCVLDLGCGTGRPVAHTLAARGFRVHGVDFSETMVRLSRQAVPSPSGVFECAHLLDWVPPSFSSSSSSSKGGGPEQQQQQQQQQQQKYGGIVASSSFFELSREQMETLVSRWRGWLEPGGVVLLAMVAAEDVPSTRPDMYDADGRFARGIPVRFMGDDCLAYLFTRAGWRALLEETAGLVVREQWAEAFTPPREADSDEEMGFYLIAQRKE